MTTKEVEPFVEQYFKENSIKDPDFIDHVNGVRRSLEEENQKPTKDNIYKLLDKYFKKEENIIKRTCKELGLTYSQLAEQIGFSEGNLNKVASTGQISKQLSKVIELYLENLELKKELENSNKIKATLKEWLK